MDCGIFSRQIQSHLIHHSVSHVHVGCIMQTVHTHVLIAALSGNGFATFTYVHVSLTHCTVYIYISEHWSTQLFIDLWCIPAQTWIICRLLSHLEWGIIGTSDTCCDFGFWERILYDVSCSGWPMHIPFRCLSFVFPVSSLQVLPQADWYWWHRPTSTCTCSEILDECKSSVKASYPHPHSVLLLRR